MIMMKLFKRSIALALAVVNIAVLAACSKQSANLDDYDNLEDYVTVGDYIGVTIPRSVVTVDDDMVQNEVNIWLKQFATTRALTEDDETANLDTVRIQFDGYIDGEYDGWEDGEHFTSTEGNPSSVEIGSGGMIPGFESNLIGHKIGEEFEFDIVFPDGYKNNPALSNVNTRFVVKIESGTRPEMPEYTDALVAEKTEYSTIAEYEESIRTKLREEADEKQLQEEVTAVWTQVMENSKLIKYPEAVVDARFNATIEQAKSYAESYDMTLEEYCKANNSTLDEFEAGVRAQCQTLVYEEMILRVIIDKEGITITDAEYEEGREQYAKDNGFADGAALEQYYDKNNIEGKSGREYITQSLVWDKTLLYLVEKAYVTDAETSAAQ